MTRAVAQKNAPGSGVLWVVVAVVVPPASVEVTVVVTVGMISEVWGGGLGKRSSVTVPGGWAANCLLRFEWLLAMNSSKHLAFTRSSTSTSTS